MGSWGQKAFENDDALDWLGDLNRDMKLVSRLKKAIKQKDPYTTRAAIEYLIRSDKARLFTDLDELGPLAMKRIGEIRTQYADPKFWAWNSKKPIPKDELKEINRAIRQATADLDRQLRYLKKAEEARLDMKRGTVSKTELSEKFEKLKKGIAKKRKIPFPDVRDKDLSEAYAEMKAAEKKTKKKKKKKSKKKAKKKTRKK